MILFFGTRVRHRRTGSGSFPCPYCAQTRTCERVASRTWFHVFWVPLVPVGRARDEMRCTVCGSEWEADVRQAS